DAALLALLCVGLRRAEVAVLRVGDYTSDSGRLVVRGKGNKQRVIWLTNGAKAAVEAWLALRGTSTTDFLLLAVNKGGKIQPAGITPQSVYGVLLKRSEQAGVECTPHDLRRTFAGEALTAGVDVVTVQALMGHSSPTTTARYDRRPDEARKTAMAAVSVPYVACGG
ncbi:MAG: site-specific integrase, partial [Actinobacteria bacterium]|nr:site-specific integrase [Actinomycetota bacterium]